MKLKPTIFDGTGLPFGLKYGHVGRIHLKLPFWDMFKSPLVIEIHDLVAVIRIKQVGEWNEEKVREAFVKA
jgi:hypothetical protein